MTLQSSTANRSRWSEIKTKKMGFLLPQRRPQHRGTTWMLWKNQRLHSPSASVSSDFMALCKSCIIIIIIKIDMRHTCHWEEPLEGQRNSRHTTPALLNKSHQTSTTTHRHFYRRSATDYTRAEMKVTTSQQCLHHFDL